ncbi:hypothetical protein B1H10_07445 [candidate division KSB1 bacterium 4484_188]|nr:MAG: hypothetical protein B1H10_07445 [candidate division KSB1 bacterium 4484_188]HFE65103.1 hypothetical protein [Caldithrix sp.]
MKKLLILFTILFILLNGKPVPAQENLKTFKDRVTPYYYCLENMPVKNFTCLFTTSEYVNFARENYDSSFTYPLKLTWIKNGRVYYTLQPYPTKMDSTRRRIFLTQVQLVTNQFKGFLLDWQNFMLYSPLSDIPDSAEIKAGHDTIQVVYTSGEGKLMAHVKKLFLPSGKLIQVTVWSGSGKVVNYPIYIELEDKWVCSGWNSQIYENGQISSGIANRMELRKIGDYWMPIRVDMLVQTSKKAEEKFLSTIFMKEFIFDVPLQEINGPPAPK